MLQAAAVLPLVSNLSSIAWGQSASEMPPVLFVHGNGDHAALWMTVALMLGAFIASLAATFGGRLRDDVSKPLAARRR